MTNREKETKLASIKANLKSMSGDDLMELLIETVGGGSESNLIEWANENDLITYTQSEITEMREKGKGKGKVVNKKVVVKKDSKSSAIDKMSWKELRAEAKRCGINSFGKSRIAVKRAVVCGCAIV